MDNPRHQGTLTADQAAELLGLHPATVRRQITGNTFPFPAKKFGSAYRIPSGPVLEFLGIEPEDQVSA